MRRARVTFKGAFHHGLNRGHDGLAIFSKNKEKEKFLELLKETSQTNRIRIFSYCLMDNHYHLALENSSGKMSNFFKQLNGQYASWYRQKSNGRGYVFQDRYKSFIIQDDNYLQSVIGYVLTNPVRANLVKSFLDYPWSSARYYFKSESCDWIDTGFIEGFYGSFANFCQQIKQSVDRKLPVINSRVGKIIGSEEFLDQALQKFNRRNRQENTSEFKRMDDYDFDSVAKVYKEFKNIHGIDGDELDISTHKGKRLRGNLLVYLKDKAGLKYREIITIPIFSEVKLHSLGKLYKDAKVRMKKGK
jgi:REP element-mobilizing transposase RayT